MAIQDRLTSEELQTYYDTAEGISLMPGWVEGEGERPPEITAFPLALVGSRASSVEKR